MLSGSLLSVLWPLLTPVPAQRPLLAAAPAVAGGLGWQVSLSKDVNSCCTTGPFISGTSVQVLLGADERNYSKAMVCEGRSNVSVPLEHPLPNS